jgi:hypothetical protein
MGGCIGNHLGLFILSGRTHTIIATFELDLKFLPFQLELRNGVHLLPVEIRPALTTMIF